MVAQEGLLSEERFRPRTTGKWREVPGLEFEVPGSRLFVWACGTGGCLTLLRALEENKPLLRSVVPFFVDSEQMLVNIYERLRMALRTYSRTEAPLIRSSEVLSKCFYPVSVFGAKKDPEKGLRFVQAHIGNIVDRAEELFNKFRCEGVVGYWGFGGGTGTLGGPFIASNFKQTFAADTAELCIATLPHRKSTRDVRNALIGLYQARQWDVRPVLVDIGHLRDLLRGVHGDRLPETKIYDMAYSRCAQVLATTLFALVNRLESLTPFDFGDLDSLIMEAPVGSVGSVMFATYKNVNELLKRWKSDLTTWETCRAAVMERKATAVAFIVGKDVPEKVHSELTDLLLKKYSVAPESLLVSMINVGPDYRVLVLRWGLDPDTIQPALRA